MAGDLAENIEAGQGQVDCAGFITILIGLLFARIAMVINSLGQEIDDSEEDVLDGSADALCEQIVSIRERQLFLNAYGAPTRFDYTFV